MNPFEFEFMQRAAIASAIVGLSAPAVGVFLVQRRLALMGDGIGHLALTGVSVGLLTGWAPLPVAFAVAVAGGIVIEALRASGKTAGDVALALLLYGGIAGGVFLTSISGASVASLSSYLFGSVLSVTPQELGLVAGMGGSSIAVTFLFRKQLFAVCIDEDAARAAGVPAGLFNLLISVMTAVTVVVAMRVVGLLLVAALMVIPVAAAQPLARSFRSTVTGSLAVGLAAALGGLVASFYLDSAPGPTIVLAGLVFYVFAVSAGLLKGKAVFR